MPGKFIHGMSALEGTRSALLGSRKQHVSPGLRKNNTAKKRDSEVVVCLNHGICVSYIP